MKKVQKLTDLAKEHGAITKTVSRRYHEFVEMGMYSADALHFACAESAGAVLLTSDERAFPGSPVSIEKRYLF